MNERNFLVVSLASLVIGCSQNLNGYPKDFEVAVGEIYSYPSGGLSDSYLRYNGMNNEKTFVLSRHSEWAVNVFYPTTVEEFEFDHEKFKLLEVTPEHIKLTYLGKK